MKVLDELLKLTLLSLHQKFRPLYFHYFLLNFFYYTQTFHFFFLYKRGLYKSWKELLHNFISFVSLILCLQLLLYRRQRLRQIISAADYLISYLIPDFAMHVNFSFHMKENTRLNTKSCLSLNRINHTFDRLDWSYILLTRNKNC